MFKTRIISIKRISSSDKFVYLCIHGVILLKLNVNYFEK